MINSRFTEQIENYNKTRLVEDKSKICQAPFRNMYFNVHGQAAACWLTFHNTDKYPQKSIGEIWRGQYYEELRSAIDNKYLAKHCGVCEKNILSSNFQNPLAKAYDLDQPINPYPSIMEFEVSNKCNLECVMCNGNLSSSIRKNRDQLDSLKSPYDGAFISQLEEFIPHLKEARFNGGEPFLHSACYEIWDKIIELNSNVEITIATNGSQYNSRIEELLKRGKFRINISVDGMTKETYETIRVNADFDKLMANIKKFGDYCHSKKAILSIMINPMRNNWFEMPDFVSFCNRNNYHLWFNTIYRPFHLSLWNLTSVQLQNIYEKLTAQNFEKLPGTEESIYYGNTMKYRNFVQTQVLNWLKEQKIKESGKKDYVNWKSDIENSPDKFKLKFESYFGAGGTNEVYEKYFEKISFIEKKISKNIEKNTFYDYLLDQNKDFIIDQLDNRSSNDFIERIYFDLQYY